MTRPVSWSRAALFPESLVQEDFLDFAVLAQKAGELQKLLLRKCLGEARNVNQVPLQNPRALHLFQSLSVSCFQVSLIFLNPSQFHI